ncbi:hypothetical protein KC334_g13143, partial [Hortaea werneckii]
VSQDQELAEDGVEEEDLLVWYLERIEEDLTSQEDVEGQKGLAKKVLRRMVKDNVLMQIRGEGLADEEGEGLQQSDRVLYVVHPNCPIDE